VAGYCEQAAEKCICWSFHGVRFIANLVMKERFPSLKIRAYCGHQYFFYLLFLNLLIWGKYPEAHYMWGKYPEAHHMFPEHV